MGKPEAIIEKHLVAQCTKFSIMCLKFVSHGNNGVPDRILIGHGQTIFVETKGVESGPRRLQRKVIAQMIAHGADVRVVHTKEQVDELIVEMIKNKNRGD